MGMLSCIHWWDLDLGWFILASGRHTKRMVTIPWPLPMVPLPVIMRCPGYRIQQAVRKLQTGHIVGCQWWDLHISGMVLPVMKLTLQEDDGYHPMTTTNGEIYLFLRLFFQSWSRPCKAMMVTLPWPAYDKPTKESEPYILTWNVAWRWLHARKICAINLKMFEMQYSVCICMSLLSYYHLDWNQKQRKKAKTVKKSKIS